MEGDFLENNKPSLTLWVWTLPLLCWRCVIDRCVLSPLQAAKIPLGIELGIDEFHFNDFSLDNDAMITASLRMFLDLGVVQKFKIDYEVRLQALWGVKKVRHVPVTPGRSCPCRFCAAGFSRWGRTIELWHITTGGMPSTCRSVCSSWSQWVQRCVNCKSDLG